MKAKRTVQENLDLLFSYIIEWYESSPKHQGSIDFHFTSSDGELHYFLTADGKTMEITGEKPERDARAALRCSHENFLRLASGKLSGVMGSITGKLKFTGDISMFSKLMGDTGIDVPGNIKSEPTPFELNHITHWKKPGKVLIITASPRGTSGYTWMFTEHLIEGMKKGGSSVSVIHLAEKSIGSCQGCWRCWLDDTGECIKKDDMKEILQQYTEADMIFFALPLYFDGMPSKMKMMFERMTLKAYPYLENGIDKTRHPQRKKQEKSLAYLAICGFPEIEHFKALREHFKAIAHNFHSPLAAEILRPGAMELANSPLRYIELLEVCYNLEEAGMQLVTKGKIKPSLLKAISRQDKNVTPFQEGSNTFWHRKVTSRAKSY